MGFSFQSHRRLFNRFFCHVKRAPMYGYKTVPSDVGKEL
jgi:hypothetical protein